MKHHDVTLLPEAITARVPEGTLLSDILADCNLQRPCGGRGVCGNCRVKVLKGNIRLTPRHGEILSKRRLDCAWRLACMSRVEDDLVIELPSNDMLIDSDVKGNVTYDNGSGGNKGIAVDLGSTTIVAHLVDLSDDRVIASSEGINPQTAYGADIISRIGFATESASNARILTDITRECIAGHIRHLLEDNNENGKVICVTIAGNTVMHHFFSGLDTEPLSHAPFQSPSNAACIFKPSQLGWDMLPADCTVEMLPNISHFIGSDIICGIQACGIGDTDGWKMLIDLGTNGEISLGCRDRIFCTSTAAGPAFEGLNIECGMRASAGAIYAIRQGANGPEPLTVGNVEPRGFCGSGLIEAIEYMLASEVIDFTGGFPDPENDRYYFAPDVYISAKDIREFQLAKGALCAGVKLLLKEAGLDPCEIGRIWLTGGLGYHIDPAKMQATGLFKDFSIEQFQKITNSSLTGARANLHSAIRSRIPGLLSRIQFCALESNPSFQDIFCREMFFPCPDFDY